MFIIGIVGALLLFGIAGFHFYWLFGGTVGTDRYVQLDKDGKRIHIGKPLILATALVFVVAGLIPFVGLRIVTLPLPDALADLLTNICLIFGIAVFAIRGCAGLVWSLMQRKPRDIFHRWNIMLYTPLCVFLAISYGACYVVFGS